MKSNIVIIFGGVSCEHDISIITAYQAKMNIDEELYNTYCVYICKNGAWQLLDRFDNFNDVAGINAKTKEVVILPSSDCLYIKKNKSLKKVCRIDCVLNCMHGVRGEDGCISALCNLNNIPYTSSDMLGSVLGLDKCAFKNYLKSADIPTVDGMTISQFDYFENVQKIARDVVNKIGFPCILKPSRLGSSIGIKVCKSAHDLPTSIENALKFDKNVLIEKYISDIKEYNIAIYRSKEGLRVSGIESPKTSEEILSFNNKYIKDKTNNACLVDKGKKEKIPKKIKNDLVKYSTRCYDIFRLKGVVRFDFIYDKNSEKLYLNEMNTIPGSLANYLFSNLDLDFQEQLTEQIEYAIHSNYLDSKLITHFDSSVLDSVDLSSLKKLKK